MPIITPIYLNPPYLVGIFKAAVEALSNYEFIINKKDLSIKSTLPLSELTCGRITQGNGAVEYSQSFVTVTIDSICQCPTTTFLKLHQMLDDNSLIKRITSLDSIASLCVGDIIDLTSPLFKDPEIKNLYSIKNSLELQLISNLSSNSIDYKSFLDYLNNTLDCISKNHCVDYFSKIFYYKYQFVMPLTKENFSDLNCIDNKPLNIFAKVAYISPTLKDTLIDDIIDPVKKFITYNNLKFPYAQNFDFDKTPNIYIGLIPLCIHV